LMTEPFNQSEQQVDIFFKLLSQSWIAIKLINFFLKLLIVVKWYSSHNMDHSSEL
jgi:hypothetical protein